MYITRKQAEDAAYRIAQDCADQCLVGVPVLYNGQAQPDATTQAEQRLEIGFYNAGSEKAVLANGVWRRHALLMAELSGPLDAVQRQQAADFMDSLRNQYQQQLGTGTIVVDQADWVEGNRDSGYLFVLEVKLHYDERVV